MSSKILTKSGYDFYVAASVLQKAIRRNKPEIAGYFAIELFESGYWNYVWKRLLTVSAEDCHGVITREIKALYDSFLIVNDKKIQDKPKGRVFISKAVLILAQAPKSRDSDHLTNLVYDNRLSLSDQEISNWIDEATKYREPVPAYAFDCHTLPGKQAGKTKKNFFKEEQKALQPLQRGLFDDLPNKL